MSDASLAPGGIGLWKGIGPLPGNPFIGAMPFPKPLGSNQGPGGGGHGPGPKGGCGCMPGGGMPLPNGGMAGMPLPGMGGTPLPLPSGARCGGNGIPGGIMPGGGIIPGGNMPGGIIPGGGMGIPSHSVRNQNFASCHHWTLSSAFSSPSSSPSLPFPPRHLSFSSSCHLPALDPPSPWQCVSSQRARSRCSHPVPKTSRCNPSISPNTNPCRRHACNRIQSQNKAQTCHQPQARHDSSA